MRKVQDISGLEYGFLTVLWRAGSASKKAVWRCRCQCGVEVDVAGDSLRRGGRRFCDRFRNMTDWHPGDPANLYLKHRSTWTCWNSMRSRCLYPSNTTAWPNYGGRGIIVCERWLQFSAFLSDMGERPSKDHTIERVDVNGNYEPGNCVWLLRGDQNLNRRDTAWIEWRGERRKFMEVCREVGTNPGLARSRIALGWGIDRAMTEPKRVPHLRAKKWTPSGPPRSALRIQAAGLLRQGWSFDAVMRKLSAPRWIVKSARRDVAKGQ